MTTNHHDDAMTQDLDRVLWPADLRKILSVSQDTIARWRKAGKLPAPDVQLSRCTTGWRISTLRAAGINLP